MIEIAQAVRDGKVVASFGPFIEFYAKAQLTVGSTIKPNESGEVTLNIDIKAPTWISVDRMEIYENGTLIEEISIPPTSETLRYSNIHTYTQAKIVGT